MLGIFYRILGALVRFHASLYETVIARRLCGLGFHNHTKIITTPKTRVPLWQIFHNDQCIKKDFVSKYIESKNDNLKIATLKSISRTV